MKRPVAFYMLLIMASIFLFFFLNLVLWFCFHTASCCVEYPLGNRE